MDCGDCTLCCELLPVQELEKKASEVCKHVCSIGCALHETKPIECINFNCLYLEEKQDEVLRPDKTNVIFEKITTKIYLGIMKSHNAWTNQDIMQYVHGLNRKGVSVIFSLFNSTEPRIFLAPEHKGDKVLSIARHIAKRNGSS